MVIHGHRVKRMGRLARVARGAVHGKSVRAAVIGVRPFSVSTAMRNGKTRQNRTTCNHRHNGKMPAEAEAPAQAAHAAAHGRVTLAVVAAMQADKVSRAAAIVRLGQTTRQAALSQIR